MISVHDRVDAILKHIDPAWLVVDFGSGDQYLKKCHPNTINVDRVNNSGINYVCDLDWEKPNVLGDVAVMSGLLEWCIYALDILKWALQKYHRVYFSYSGWLADNNWAYTTTIEEIEHLLKSLGCEYTTETWQGQIIFFVEPTAPSVSPI